MADYQKIIAARPEVGEFIRARRAIRYRGEAMSYAPNLKCDSFSTDGSGFRHSVLRGESLSVAESRRSRRYGLVLGASNSFGFGLAGNENTMSSLLGERFGFPFANVSMPGANSRNLHSLLMAFLSGIRPAVVVHSSGGDLSTFCESSLADPVFGSPNRAQLKTVVKQASQRANAEADLPKFLAFTTLWTSAIVNLCRAHAIPIVLVQQGTFFEKRNPSRLEQHFRLGEPILSSHARQFENHKKFNQPFSAARKSVSDRLGIPLAGVGLSESLTFIDEFHCDYDGTRLLTNAVGDVIEPMIQLKETRSTLRVG
ncbi:MAG TPA: hypothetical protein VFP53_09820 [Sphingomicrobium sp.]|nr:hypothetical protein [Sphingomicrobium sp.]